MGRNSGVLEVKIIDSADVGSNPFAFLMKILGQAWVDALSHVGGVHVRRTFSDESLILLSHWAGTSLNSFYLKFENFLTIECSSGLTWLSNFFHAQSHHALEYVQEVPDIDVEEPVAGAPCSEADQGYLSQAPVGVDAHYAWDKKAAGKGVKMVDVEQGWQFVDIPDFEGAKIVEIPGGENQLDGHGTKVLGIIGANKNGKGVTGIAYDLDFIGLSSVVRRINGGIRRSLHDAIVSGARELLKGDVMLIESYEGTKGGVVPVEAVTSIFRLLRFIIPTREVCVIEPAGNGQGDLGITEDSGAIMVGAVTAISRPAQAYEVWAKSNFGDRIDCYAWGNSICTTSIDGTSFFRGTSGASAIIAGVVACTQSFARQGGRPGLSPSEMRTRVSGLGAEVWNPITKSKERGQVPDLKKIIEAIPPPEDSVPIARRD